MHPRRPEVGLTTARSDLGLEPFVLAAADVRQLDPVGARRGRSVEIDGHFEAIRDPPAEGAGHLDAVVDRGLAERHERNDVDRPDARMLAPVHLHVDLMDGDRHRPFEGLGDGLGLSGDRQDASVVAGVHRAIEQKCAANTLHRVGESLDDVEPSTLAEIGHRFDEAHRALS